MTPDPMQRLQAKAEARAIVVDSVARMLWENGPQSSDWEGGAPPSWDDIRHWRQNPAGEVASSEDRDLSDSMASYYLDYNHRAEDLLAFQPQDALALAKILIDRALAAHDDLERQLWRRLEDARGLARGTLSMTTQERLAAIREGGKDGS